MLNLITLFLLKVLLSPMMVSLSQGREHSFPKDGWIWIRHGQFRTLSLKFWYTFLVEDFSCSRNYNHFRYQKWKVVNSIMVWPCPLQSNNFEQLAFSLAGNLFSLFFHFFALTCVFHSVLYLVHLKLYCLMFSFWIITLLSSCSLKSPCNFF